MEESDRTESACIYHLFRNCTSWKCILTLGAARLQLSTDWLLFYDAGAPRIGFWTPWKRLVLVLRRCAASRCAWRRRAGIGDRFLRPRWIKADGDCLPRCVVQLELRGGKRKKSTVTCMLIVVGDWIQWRVTVIFLLNLFRGRAIHVVFIGASVIVPGKVAVVYLLLAVLPPLVAVVVRRKGIHLPHALLFPCSMA